MSSTPWFTLIAALSDPESVSPEIRRCLEAEALRRSAYLRAWNDPALGRARFSGGWRWGQWFDREKLIGELVLELRCAQCSRDGVEGVRAGVADMVGGPLAMRAALGPRLQNAEFNALSRIIGEGCRHKGIARMQRGLKEDTARAWELAALELLAGSF